CFATAVNTAKFVAQALMSHGHIRRAYIGIARQNVDLPRPLVRQLDLLQDGRVLVTGAEPHGPAHLAGLTEGDVLIACNRRDARFLFSRPKRIDPLLRPYNYPPANQSWRSRHLVLQINAGHPFKLIPGTKHSHDARLRDKIDIQAVADWRRVIRAAAAETF